MATLPRNAVICGLLASLCTAALLTVWGVSFWTLALAAIALACPLSMIWGWHATQRALEPLKANVTLDFLSPTSPNLLTIQREDGLGRLFYNVVLKVNRPVQDVKPINAGMGSRKVVAFLPNFVCTPSSGHWRIHPSRMFSAWMGEVVKAEMRSPLR